MRAAQARKAAAAEGEGAEGGKAPTPDEKDAAAGGKPPPKPKDAHLPSDDPAHFPDGLVHYDLDMLEAQKSYAASRTEQPEFT